MRGWAEERPGTHVALVGKDPGEVRDVMIEGRGGGSAIMEVCPPCFMPRYEPSKKLLTWPNGSKASAYSSEEYEELRGPQHHKAWVDEPAKFRYLEQVLSNLDFGLRLGDSPQAVFTTTPRPIPAFKELLREPGSVVTGGSTDDNLENLSPKFRKIIDKYRGTRLGRQEIDAELLDDTPGALWTLAIIDATRVQAVPEGVQLVRVVVAVDPQATSASREELKRRQTEEEDERATGIVVCARGSDGRGYVLADRTVSGRPEAWARRAVQSCRDFKADRIVGEANNGGEMVEAVIKAQDRHAPVKLVHASRGKVPRAEPVSLHYENGTFSHVGAFPELEDEMTTYVPGEPSPNRMDALVWAFTELFEREFASLSQVFSVGERASMRQAPAARNNGDLSGHLAPNDFNDMNLGPTAGGMNL